MAVKVVAFVSIKPGGDAAFVAAAQRCVVASRAEPGVLYYELWQEADGERRFVFNELYVDDAAVRAHMASDHFAAFGAAIADLATTHPTIVVANPVDVGDALPA